MGKGSTVAGKLVRSVTVLSKSHQIGEIKHFAKFVLSPDVPAKMSRIVLSITKSCRLAVRKIATSSAYKKTLSLILWCSDLSKPMLSARRNKALRASMTMTNKSGDNGSPWRRPLAWQIRLPNEPFVTTRVLAEERISAI